jgi:hypothetical protein
MFLSSICGGRKRKSGHKSMENGAIKNEFNLPQGKGEMTTFFLEGKEINNYGRKF